MRGLKRMKIMHRIKNKSIIVIALSITVFVMCFLSSCFKEVQPNQDGSGKNYDNPTDIQKEEIAERKNLYDFTLLYSYKNLSLSDIDKVNELICQLQ